MSRIRLLVGESRTLADVTEGKDAADLEMIASQVHLYQKKGVVVAGADCDSVICHVQDGRRIFLNTVVEMLLNFILETECQWRWC